MTSPACESPAGYGRRMGRALRILDPSFAHHVVAKGNDGGWIVRDALDRATFRQRLDGIAAAYGWEALAWCLMRTHAHFVLRAPLGAISGGMQELLGGHARYVNRRHDRNGHLFRNRFFSKTIDTDAYQVASIAYVNRNPVHHLACEDAADWRDSSYRATMGFAEAPAWLNVDESLALFGRDVESGRRALAWHVGSGRVPVSDTITEVQRFEPVVVL